MYMEAILMTVPFLVFIFGLIIGSFLNVVIYRYNTGRSVARGRSACFSCGKTLRWYELIPVVSYLWQKRRCRSCTSVLSSQYVIVELLTAILFTAIAARVGFFETLVPSFDLFFWWIVASVLVVITVYDLRHTIIPDGLSLLVGMLGLLSLYMRGGGPADLAVGIITAFIFGAIWLVSKGKAMGLGDAKLVLGIGWLLPFAQSITAIVVSFWLGAIIGIALIVLKRKHMTMKSEIPFAPFLAAGVMLVFLANVSLILVW